ncbi:unnamed protein product [Mytilus edulis]|uniref:Tyrosinase copper-binding domain-containing protein n=2 Tax=Mytilus edulis TaxID=6550 RepID=A0A8S3TBT4_MYTED|nr:unnamed protein product [Mytilus edulis]
MEAPTYVTLALLTLGYAVTVVVSLIEPVSLPYDLDRCITQHILQSNTSHTPPHLAEAFCVKKFILHNPNLRVKVNFTTDETDYIQSLFKQVEADAGVDTDKGRFRRQTGGWRRHRREIRSAPYLEWQQYVRAVTRLKRVQSGTNGRSRYDTLAAIHTAAVDEVHFGPSFCPWHRLYLILVETALRVPIPYWDPTIDGAMDDPTQSVVWTNKYFGNGNGPVVVGPFRHYYTPTGPLSRDIGSDGLLFSKENIQRLFRFRFNRDIFEPASLGDQMSTLEGQHNMVHFWIGGHMNEFEYAAYDPVFWNYHAYVDYVWENFRRLQVRRGVNPEMDIVRSWQQDADSFAVGLQGLRIREGYSGRIAGMVTYESMPKCPECGNSADMFCRRDVCVATSGSYRRNRISFPRRVFNRGSFRNLFRRLRGKRSLISQFNGVKDTSIELTDLAFVPVKVIRNRKEDITNYTSLNTTIETTQVVSQECIRHPETLHNNIIYAESDGLNYKGKYKDSAYVNQSAIIYIGAQKPTNDTSKVFITAYDRCGRICVPNCLVKDSQPPIYKTCTGAIRITSQNPVMYVSFPYDSELQQQANTAIPPIEFHCTF